MTYTRKMKWLSIVLAVCMLAALLPAFLSFAEERVDAEYEAALTQEAGNLAIGAAIISQYGAHNDGNWGWSINNLNDGTTNYTGVGGQIGNGGYHTNPGAGLQGGKHSEWVGYDFGAPTEFNTVVLYPCRESDGKVHSFPNTFSVQISSNSIDWITVTTCGDITFDEYGPYTVSFENVTAQYVRILAYATSVDVNNLYYMKISEIAVYNDANAAAYCPNLALNATVTTSSWHNDGTTWSLGGINDGDRYNFNGSPFDFGQYAGWHTTPGDTSSDAWAVFDFKSAKKVDKVVVWPATERYKNGNDALALPTAIIVESSENGSEWSELTRLTTMPTVYGPIELTFTATETQYIRVLMPRNNHVKLSEIEVFDTSVSKVPGVNEGDTPEVPTVTIPDVNLALDATVVGSQMIVNPDWAPTFLNNGVIEAQGFSSASETEGNWVGYEFENPTTVNKIVLYSSLPTGDDEGAWSGIPKVFAVEHSIDGFNWTTATIVTNASVPVGQDALTVSFDTAVAKIIRIRAIETYPKVTDGGRLRLQLAEMEVWYTESATTLPATDTVSAYLQTRAAKDAEGNVTPGYSDLRVVLVGNLSELVRYNAVTVTMTFTLDGMEVKSFTRTLGGANSDYQLYSSIIADGEKYVAAEGCAIFGNVITDIPDGDYTDIEITVSEAADPANVLYYGTTLN